MVWWYHQYVRLVRFRYSPTLKADVGTDAKVVEKTDDIAELLTA